MLVDLLIILALIVMNGFLAGAEIAIIAVRKTRVAELVGDGSLAARAIERLRADPERFLATVQIGITVVSATAAAFGGSRIAARVAVDLRQAPGLATWADEIALAAVIATVSYLSLVLGELVPKSLALRAAEGYALFSAPALHTLSRLTHPAVAFLTGSSNLVLRAFGDRTTFTESRLSADELRQLLEEAGAVGSVHAGAGEIAARAIDLGGLSAGDVMIPWRSVVSVARSTAPDELLRILAAAGHARIPVYDGSDDNVIGYLATRDVLALAARGLPLALGPLIVPGIFVPEMRKAVDLLHELRQRRIHLAFVVSEHGSLLGIVTLEDLFEELVGEIWSERDAKAPPAVRPEPDGSYLVDGAAPIREVNREADLELPEGDDWTTVAGLCLYLAGDIPAAGTRLRSPDGTVIEVTSASHRRVRAVRIIPAAREPAQSPSRG